MPLGTSYEISSMELEEIFVRLRPYLPPQLTRVEPRPGGYGLRYVLSAFTGREPQPLEPPTHDDPQLTYVREADDAEEHLLREKARAILADVYRQAREDWRTAVYVADLQAAIQDAPALWQAHQDAQTDLTSAFEYLRTPQASTEWPSALSRLVDAQDHAAAAAAAFDERAYEIAQVHDKHLYGHITRDGALEKAGYPEATEWHIAEPYHYQQSHYSELGTHPLAEQTRRRIAGQDAHVAKVGRLAGTAD